MIVHRHASMWARRTQDNPDQVQAVMDHHRRASTVITGTEAGAPIWDKKLLRDPRWGVLHEPGPYGHGDPFVTWDRDVWEDRRGFVRCMSRVTYNGRRVHFAAQKLLHRYSNRRVWFLAGHMPAHLETDMRRARRTTRTIAYTRALVGLRRLVKRIRVEHPHSRIVVAADWNLNLHRRWVRVLFRGAFRGTGLRLVPIRTKEGTHGPRLIDWALTDLRSEAEVLNHTSASDHKPVLFVHEERP